MMPREHTCWNPLPCTCEDPDDDATATTPGVPREARSLSGMDLGREVLRGAEWETITAIHHDTHGVRIDWGDNLHGDHEWFHPHNVVQVRGRED